MVSERKVVAALLMSVVVSVLVLVLPSVSIFAVEHQSNTTNNSYLLSIVLLTTGVSLAFRRAPKKTFVPIRCS